MAALSGHAIALLPAVIIADGLQAGNLIQLLPEFRTTEAIIQAVCPSSQLLPAKTGTFIDSLVGRLRQDHDWVSYPLAVVGNTGRTHHRPGLRKRFGQDPPRSRSGMNGGRGSQ
jgi:hypothetical protein